MKTKGIYLALVLFSFITWSCTSQDGLGNQSLKTSITANAQELSTAVNSITSSSGYGILTNSDLATSPSMVKSSVEASTVVTPATDSITLAQIAGIYDYKAAKYKKWSPLLFNFFAKTGTSSDFIVRMPEAKIKHPKLLLLYSPADTTLVNDYVIDVSKYNYVFGRYLWNYNLASTITVKNVSIGSLTVQSSRNKSEGQNFVSGFTFANGYDAKLKYSTGDTILSVYNISKGGTTLFEEKFTAIKDSASHHREKQYSLTIGNVQIIRTPTHGNNGLDSAKVYLGGVLQTKAVVKITDSGSTDDSTEFSVIGHNRDLQITFDDGTSTTVNQLLGSTITDVRSLFVSLRQVYFATNVVDWVAWSVKLNRLNM